MGDVALSHAVKALATGDPLILEKAGVDNDVARLGRLRQAHDRDQTALARTVATGETRAGHREEALRRLLGAMESGELVGRYRWVVLRLTWPRTAWTSRRWAPARTHGWCCCGVRSGRSPRREVDA